MLLRAKHLITIIVCAGWAALASHCVQAAQTYPLVVQQAQAKELTGSLQVERIEGGQRLVVVQLDQLPPPERLGAGLTEFVVWLEDPQGTKVKAGTLRYDRAHRSGNLLATTQLPTFTLQVTGERDANASTPSNVVLAERKVITN